MSTIPEFSLKNTRYDLKTYWGRFEHFLAITDPRNLFYSNDEILEADNVLKKYKSSGIICGSSTDMWNYRKIAESSIHPVTNEIINPLVRVSAIAPANIPIVFAMLACPPSNVGGTLFLHWFNQSYNTACNYANRSGASQDLSQIALAYTLAVSSACTFAYGLGKAVERGPHFLKRFGLVIPFLATAAANISNITLTRGDEILTGSPVFDADGKIYGKSKHAGIVAVAQTAVTRCVLVPASCLFLPPLAMSGLNKMKLLPKNKHAVMFLELSIIYASLQAALPAALAVYPQTVEFDTSDLESEFKTLFNDSGKPVTRLFCNKGL